MEKDVAIREWCIERAIDVKGASFDNQRYIRCAKEIEAYILGKESEALTSTPIRYCCSRCDGDLETLYISKGEELIAQISCPKCDK